MNERITAAEYNRLVSAPQKAAGTKRVAGAVPTMADGIKFHSKREARRWQELCVLQQQGRVSCLERQVKVPLMGKNGPILTPKRQEQAHYIADFAYVDWDNDGKPTLEDAKGYATEVFRIKRAILAAQGVEIKLT